MASEPGETNSTAQAKSTNGSKDKPPSASPAPAHRPATPSTTNSAAPIAPSEHSLRDHGTDSLMTLPALTAGQDSIRTEM